MTTPYPQPSSQAVTAVMRGNRRRDTRPELALRSLLHRAGHRFRVDLPVEAAGVRVRPDIVFPRQRVAVFVDGCFWHACPEHGTQPRSNPGYWEPKLKRNQERDQRVTAALRADGWAVLRIWEHQRPEDAAVEVQSLLRPAPEMVGRLGAPRHH